MDRSFAACIAAAQFNPVPPPLPFDDFDSPVRQPEFDSPRQQQPRPAFYVPDKKSAGVAAVMSFFWPGLGQIYNGQIGKALLFMFVWPPAWWGAIVMMASMSASTHMVAKRRRTLGLGFRIFGF